MQTLLFSATQTRVVADLARLALSAPEFVSVHEAASAATPPRLMRLTASGSSPSKARGG